MTRVDEIYDDLELLIAEHKAFRRVIDENTKLKSAIEDIKAEIRQNSLGGIGGDRFIFTDNVIRIIDKHINGKEMSKIDCNKTSCNNCANHNYCDYENNKHIRKKEQE